MSLRLPPEEYKQLCLRIMSRDQWRCRNPYCGFRGDLHCHHIIFRSEQGVDESWNLVTLCSDCHAAAHRYELRIEVGIGNFVGQGGGADGELIFSKGDLV